MQKDIVHNAINDPELIVQSDTSQWSEITRHFPYFTAAQLLLTKAYQEKNDYRFTDQLHQAAIYTGDRKLLYDWVKKTNLKKREQADDAVVIAEEPIAITPVPQPVPEPETKEQVTSREKAADLADLIMSEEIIPVIVPQAEREIKPAPEVLAAPEVKAEEPKQEATLAVQPEDTAPPIIIRASDIEPLEREILLEAVHSSIEQEVTPEHSTEERVETEEENIPLDKDSYAGWIYHRSQQIHFGEEKSTGRPEDETPQAVSDWTRPENVEPAELAEETSNEIEDIPVEENNRLSHGVKKISAQDPRSHQKALIDRFIKLEPNIARGKAGDYSPGNIAKDSLEEDFSFVTETMAQLFARQGKMDKARKAFRKLMELYPEKSVYFAAQLKNLDKLKK